MTRLPSQIRSLVDPAIESHSVAFGQAFTDAPPARLALMRGLAWPILRLHPSHKLAFEALVPLWTESADHDSARIIDDAGHALPVYRGLLLYSAFQAIRASDQVLVERQARGVIRWVESLLEDLPTSPGVVISASQGAQAAGDAWAALALFVAGDLLSDDRCLISAGRYFAGLAAAQRPAGHFLKPTPRDNLESFWFHELQLLHAIASFGLQSGVPSAIAASRKAAQYHVAETQPDHATQDPWGLPAFALDKQTEPMAEQLLHSAAARSSGGLTTIALILLADSLYSISQLRSSKHTLLVTPVSEVLPRPG